MIKLIGRVGRTILRIWRLELEVERVRREVQLPRAVRDMLFVRHRVEEREQWIDIVFCRCVLIEGRTVSCEVRELYCSISGA